MSDDEQTAPNRTVRRRGNASASSQQTEPKSTEPLAESISEASVSGEAVSQQRAFVVAGAVGLALALLGLINSPAVNWVGLFGPVLTVFAFYRIGMRSGWSRVADARQRFADACYFLGFLFTMLALMIGFIPAGLGLRDLTSDEILRHFGMALGATAAGLICRILVLQSASPDEVAASVEASLQQYAGRLADETRKIVADIVTIRTEITDTQRLAAENLTVGLKEALSGLVGQFGDTVTEIRTQLYKQAGSAQSSTEQFVGTIAARSIEIERIAGQASEAHSEAARAASDVAVSLKALNASLASINADSQTALVNATATIKEIAQSLKSIAAKQDDIADLVDRVMKQADQTEAAAEIVRQNTEASQAAIIAWSAEAAQFVPKISAEIVAGQAAASASVGTSARNFATDIQAATDELALTVNDFSRQLRTLRTNSDQSNSAP